MILVAGGSGRLGTELVARLLARTSPVRVLTRDPERARRTLGEGPDLVGGDVRKPATLPPSLEGADVVVSAITGFGPGGPGPRAVDFQGNLNLLRAAETAGVGRFVLVSVDGAAADHPMELMRMKNRAEEALRTSTLDWVIVRPTAFMELWAGIVGRPIADTGRATVFGRGDNPINFVSTGDVARLIELSLFERKLSRKTLTIGGPENFTLNQLVEQIEQAAHRKAVVRHIPVPVLRLASVLLRPIRPDIAGMIEAGLGMATTDMTFDPTTLHRSYPEIELTHLADVLHRQFATPRATTTSTF